MGALKVKKGGVFQAVGGESGPWLAGITTTPKNITDAVSVTADATAHTKGVWTELVASTTGETSLMHLAISGVGSNATNTASLLDIAVGSAGSETVIVPNIGIGGASTSFGQGAVITIPVRIPSGSRVSARMQSVVTGGKTAQVRASFYTTSNPSEAPTSVDVFGAVTENSTGIVLSGASGSWVEVTSSTSKRYRGFVLVGSTHTANLGGSGIHTFTLGTGSSGSEQNIGSITCESSASESIRRLNREPVLFIAADVPAGTRLVYQHTLTSGASGHGLTIIGIPAT